MTYQETIDWMFSQLPMYQRQGKTAFKKDLTNIVAFCHFLKNPQKEFPSIHVGGTNGKGSTSHLISSILQEAGYKVGLYTSPHLKSFTERIRINGQEIPQKEVMDFIAENQQFLEKQGLSFFEMTVGMAFAYFAKQKVEIAIVEVGLGGRLDSTNIITPEVSVITNIGYDHQQFLGETLSEIAVEKAGIIKKNTPVVVGERQEEVLSVFSNQAEKMNARIVFASDHPYDLKTDLLGSYQAHNVNTAIHAIYALENFVVSEGDLKRGLLHCTKNTHLMGRWQLMQEHPKVICDTAHNKEGLQYVMRQLTLENAQNTHIVLGVVNDKKLEELLHYFPQEARYYFCQPNIPRGLNARELQQEATRFHLYGEVYDSVKEAYETAISTAQEEDLIFVGGSTFVVAEVV